MNEEPINCNRVTLSGEIITEFRYNHEMYGEFFYTFMLKVDRLSQSEDIIPIIISDRIIDVNQSAEGQHVRITGQYRSYNHHHENGSKLVLSVFALDAVFINAEEYQEEISLNEILLDGFLCKPPVYRKTPMGKEIADLLVAVNRSYGKSDYIPCICWGRNARFAAKLDIGSRIQIEGRIQSRTYQKRLDDHRVEERTAYEVSAGHVESIIA